MENIVINFGGRRQRLLAAAFALTLGLSACKVTDLQPVDVLSESAVYNDPARIALAVTGVYNSAQSGFYDPLNGNALAVRGYPFGAAANSLGDARGEDVVDMAGFYGVIYNPSTVTTAAPNVVNIWSNCYALINQANVTIAGVQGAVAANVIPAATGTVYEAELRFLRALAHFELVLNFSRPYLDGAGTKPGVPYHDYAINTPAAIAQGRAQDRGTVADDYTKMLADLDFAEANLPVARTITTGTTIPAPSVTRAAKGAAIALKQRIRLHQGNWAAVITEGTKLITGTATPFASPIGGYMLTATQRATFPGGATASVESIFSIENRSDDNPGTNGALPSVFGSAASPANGGIGGRALLAVSPTLYNAPFFTCGDLRRTTMMQLDPTGSGRYVIRKYTDAATNSDFAPIIRYAEVLLNQAEAIARAGGNDALALSMLNAVRNRSVTTATDQFAAGSLTGSALVKAILNERRIEFVGEGLRWGDLSRLALDASYAPLAGGGIPAKFNGNLGAGQISIARYGCQDQSKLTGGDPASIGSVPYSSNFFLWPIPALEIANNPLLKQNDGY